MKALVALLFLTPGIVWAAEPGQPPGAVEAGPGDGSAVTPPGQEQAAGAEEGAASDTGLAYGVEADLASRYVWRGLAFSDQPVLQPSARVSDYGATLLVSSSAYLGRAESAERTLSELDLIGSYDLTLGKATISPSIGVYMYPGAPGTGVLGATVRYDLDLIVLQTRQALDIVDNAGGWYGDIGAVRSQPIMPWLTFEATGSLACLSGSFGRYYIDPSIEGLHFGAAQLDSSFVLEPTDALYFRLHGTFSRMLEHQIRDFAADDNLFSGGLAVGLAR